MTKIMIDDETTAEVLDDEIKEITFSETGELNNEEVEEKLLEEELLEGFLEEDVEDISSQERPSPILETNDNLQETLGRFQLDNLKEEIPPKSNIGDSKKLYSSSTKNLYSTNNPENLYLKNKEGVFNPEFYEQTSLVSFYDEKNKNSLYIAPSELNENKIGERLEVGSNLEKNLDKKDSKKDLMFRS